MTGKPVLTMRSGFTLVEVLIASTIMVIGLLGILGLAFNAIKKADTPETVQQAIKLGQERLDYFRGFRNAYMVAGGTYYPPPARNQRDYNLSPDGNTVNNVFNGAPALFVREYLYAFDEHRAGVYKGNLAVDGGHAAMRERGKLLAPQGANATFAPNEIPPTPALTAGGAAIWGVCPNPDDVPYPGNSSYIANGFAVTPPGAVQPYSFTYAPRANDQIRATGTALDPAIKFVREVWIQTNNPGGFPGARCPDMAKIRMGAGLSTLGGLQYAANLPATQTNLPAFTVAVTVRVFARDPRTLTIVGTDPGSATSTRLLPESTTTSGPGYNRSHPLVTMVGYYGLRRWIGGAPPTDPQS
jgi:prepilin-type N-terminal cleavage/methylation domain-containing protein